MPRRRRLVVHERRRLAGRRGGGGRSGCRRLGERGERGRACGTTSLRLGDRRSLPGRGGVVMRRRGSRHIRVRSRGVYALRSSSRRRDLGRRRGRRGRARAGRHGGRALGQAGVSTVYTDDSLLALGAARRGDVDLELAGGHGGGAARGRAGACAASARRVVDGGRARTPRVCGQWL